MNNENKTMPRRIDPRWTRKAIAEQEEVEVNKSDKSDSVDPSKWVKDKLESITQLTDEAAGRVGHPAIRRLSRRGHRHNELIFRALAQTLRLIQKLTVVGDKQYRKAIRNAFRRHYKNRGYRKPRQGTNPFVPLVRLCFPDSSASDRDRYVGLLSHAFLNEWKPKQFHKRYKGAKDKWESEGKGAFSMKALGMSAKSELLEQRPELASLSEWKK